MRGFVFFDFLPPISSISGNQTLRSGFEYLNYILIIIFLNFVALRSFSVAIFKLYMWALLPEYIYLKFRYKKSALLGSIYFTLNNPNYWGTGTHRQSKLEYAGRRSFKQIYLPILFSIPHHAEGYKRSGYSLITNPTFTNLVTRRAYSNL